MKLTEEKIRQALSKFKKCKAAETNFVQAAVLVPLFYRDDEFHLLFTQRSSKVTYHKGQVSFPGGVYTKDDPSLLATALRESHEEIGLEPKDVDILGELDDTVTIFSGFVISPFVAFIPHPYPFKINAEEIDYVFDIPLSIFRNKDRCKVEYQIVGNEVFPTYFYEYKGRTVWGATARIINQLVYLLCSECGAPL